MYSFAKDELVIDKVIAVKDENPVPQDKDSSSNKLSGRDNRTIDTNVAYESVNLTYQPPSDHLPTHTRAKGRGPAGHYNYNPL